MKVRLYDPIKDFDMVNKWAEQWGNSYSSDLLPPTGLIIDGIVAYFCYETNSSVCFLENLISNKNADESVRLEAMNMIVPAMFDLAKQKGFKVAYACTNNSKVIQRGLLLNCKVDANYALLSKIL